MANFEINAPYKTLVPKKYYVGSDIHTSRLQDLTKLKLRECTAGWEGKEWRIEGKFKEKEAENFLSLPKS